MREKIATQNYKDATRDYLSIFSIRRKYRLTEMPSSSSRRRHLFDMTSADG
jgi:hypothetical protein